MDQPYTPAIVGGRYRVTSVLRRGDRSDTLIGLDVRDDREVVLKRLRFANRAEQGRLRAAHTALSSLGSPTVAASVDLIDGRRDSWMIFDRVGGVDLDTYWSLLPIPVGSSFQERWAWASPLVTSILMGLEALHRSDFPHLDLKPANVRVDPLGVARVVGLGMGLAGTDENEGAQEGVMTSSALGFQAPEVFECDGEGYLSDQWSLGALLYYLITGRKPVDGSSLEELTAAYDRGSVGSCREHCSDIPTELDDAILKMLSWNPGQRFSDLAEVRQALGALLVPAVEASVQTWSSEPAPTVGREPFLSFLRKRLSLLREGQGAVVRLEGAGGAGKSRLVEVWRDLVATSAGVEVYATSCQPGVPRTVLSGWFNPPRTNIDLPPPTDLVARALRAFKKPTVLLLDALEEVDAICWARIRRTAIAALDGSTPSPLLVVLVGRALPDLGQLPAGADGRVFNVALPSLVTADVLQLLRPESESEEDAELLGGVAATLCLEANGGPGALMDLLVAGERDGSLVRDGRRWIPKVGGRIEEAFPEVDPPERHEVLGYLAALGSTLPVRLLLDCIPLRRDRSIAVLVWAADRGHIVFREAGGHWFVSIEGRAPDTSTLDELRLVYRRAALWLELNQRVGGLGAERIADYWREAGENARAAGAYLRASDAEAAIGSHADARRLHELGSALSARSARAG